MKKTTAALLGLALTFTAHAQTAAGLLSSSHLAPHSSNSATTIIMMQACEASRAGIKGIDFAKAVYAHYRAYNWAQANFDSLIDAGYGFAGDNPRSDCAQIAIDVIDNK